MWYPILVTVIMAYLLGNLNGSVLISRLTRDEDVRTHGSGNAGLTNFFRSYGGKATLLVGLCDAGKTIIAVLAGGLILRTWGSDKLGMAIAAVAVSIGHDFPALLGFRGGKGIMCGFFALVVLDWRIASVVFVLFAAAYAFTKYVSLGSIIGAITYITGFIVVYHKDLPVMLCGVFIGGLALYMHRSNMVRLIKGTESKIYLTKKGKKS